MSRYPLNTWVVTEHLTGMTVRRYHVVKFLDKANANGEKVVSRGDIFDVRSKAETCADKYNREESLGAYNPNAACGRPCANCGACRPA